VSAKKGLGRSFDSLIPTDLFDESFDPTAQQDDKISDLRAVVLSEISPDPNQPRRHFDEAGMEELAASIREHGVLQPIVVTPARGGGYQIVAGERRYRAAKMAGLKKLPVLVRTLSDQHKLELSLIENIQRRDLNPLETATAYLKLRDQFNMTLEQIGARVGGKSMAAVSNTMRLLRLPEKAKAAIIEGKLTEGQARPLVGIDHKTIEDVIDRIIGEEWSARKIEKFVTAIKKSGVIRAVQTAERSVKYEPYAQKLGERFSTDVRVKMNARGGGHIVITFKNQGDLGRIQKLL
jgi:ParB family chromosome partitioning protein